MDVRERRTMRLGTAACVVGGLAAFAVVAYPGLWRDRCLNWGATPEEVDREMAGDGLLPAAPVVATRAIGISAPPADIWPWLVQMGPGRGGAYTYDWIENLFRLDMHSADEILPEHQRPEVGDSWPLGKRMRMRLEVLEAERAMVLRSEDGSWVWSFGLYPQSESLTRLVSRNRIQDPRTGLANRVVSMFLMEPGSLVMERKMLLGIKERAERLRARQTQPA
jgi:hypothetical protein